MAVSDILQVQKMVSCEAVILPWARFPQLIHGILDWVLALCKKIDHNTPTISAGIRNLWLAHDLDVDYTSGLEPPGLLREALKRDYTSTGLARRNYAD